MTPWDRPQIVPVLRAGLVLLEQAQQVIPVSETYHVGYVRDEETLQVWGMKMWGQRFQRYTMMGISGMWKRCRCKDMNV